MEKEKLIEYMRKAVACHNENPTECLSRDCCNCPNDYPMDPIELIESALELLNSVEAIEMVEALLELLGGETEEDNGVDRSNR